MGGEGKGWDGIYVLSHGDWHKGVYRTGSQGALGSLFCL